MVGVRSIVPISVLVKLTIVTGGRLIVLASVIFTTNKIVLATIPTAVSEATAASGIVFVIVAGYR